MEEKESLKDFGEVKTKIYPIENNKVVVALFLNNWAIMSTEIDKDKLEKMDEDNEDEPKTPHKTGKKLENFGKKIGKDIGSTLSDI